MTPEESLKAGQEYLDQAGKVPDVLLREVVSMRVNDIIKEGGDLKSTQAWMLGVPEGLIGEADQNIFRQLIGNNNVDQATDYLQQIVNGVDAGRTARAIEAFAQSYAFVSPSATIDWALKLPSSIPHCARAEAVIAGFRPLNALNPALAERKLGEIADVEIRASVSSYLKMLKP